VCTCTGCLSKYKIKACRHRSLNILTFLFKKREKVQVRVLTQPRLKNSSKFAWLMTMKLQRLQVKACYTSGSSSMLNLPCNSDAACSLTFCSSEQMPSKQEDR